jgi:hypothetical protein
VCIEYKKSNTTITYICLQLGNIGARSGGASLGRAGCSWTAWSWRGDCLGAAAAWASCKYLSEEEDLVGSGGPRGGGSDIGLQQRQWPSQWLRLPYGRRRPRNRARWKQILSARVWSTSSDVTPHRFVVFEKMPGLPTAKRARSLERLLEVFRVMAPPLGLGLGGASVEFNMCV